MGDKPSSQTKKPSDGDSSESEKLQKSGSTSPSPPTDGGSEAAADAVGRTKSKAAGEAGGGHGGTKPAKIAPLPSVKVDPPPGEEHHSPTKKSPSATTRRSSAAVEKSPKGKAAQRSKKSQPVKGQRSSVSTGASKQQQRQLSRKKKRKSVKGDVAPADPNQRLEFPTTPEMILAIHKSKPFLDRNEEWLVVELNEYECLVENLDIIKTIANHSKFFEVEPDELWEEFFEYVEEMPSYDEVINYDVWQEFRDERYPC